MGTVLSIILGGLITILTAVGIEYLRRPVLSLTIETPPYELPSLDNPNLRRRHLRLKLRNEPLHWFGRLILRSAALQCRGEITSHNLDGQDVFGRAMAARWAETPEPIMNQVIDLQDRQAKFVILDFARTNSESCVDIYPGEEKTLDVAVRFQNELDCYGWNNESYPYKWRTPHWKLPPDRFLVKLVITSSNQKCIGKFRLVNNVESHSDFRLTELGLEDRAKYF